MRVWLCILLVILLENTTSINCITLSSSCLTQSKQIHRVGIFRDRNDNPTDFVYTITQYNSSKCEHEQYVLKYKESISCKYDVYVPYDLSCQATINSIYVSISSVAEMLKYGYICSESDVHKEVEIDDSSCHIKGKSGFLELVRKVKTTHQFAMNHFDNNMYQIGTVLFSADYHDLCYKSYTTEIIIGVVCAVVLMLLIVFGIIIIRRIRARWRSRLAKSNRKDIRGVEKMGYYSFGSS